MYVNSFQEWQVQNKSRKDGKYNFLSLRWLCLHVEMQSTHSSSNMGLSYIFYLNKPY